MSTDPELVAERQRVQEALRVSERKYRKMFESAAVSLWEEDFSALRAFIEQAKQEGVTDFRAHVGDHPEFLATAMGLLRVLDVNEATLRLFGARTKEELLGNIEKTFVPESAHAFVEAIVAIAEGRAHFEAERVARRLDGTRINVLVAGCLPTDASDSSAVVSMFDLTEQKLRKLYLERMLATQDEERRRIGRELHDETGQSLTSLVVGLQEIRETDSIAVAKRLSRRLQRIAESAIDEIGRLARGLHPYLLEDLGLDEALKRHVAKCILLSGLDIDLEVVRPHGDYQPPMGLATTIYRVVQEALHNVIKHAEARSVSVVLTWTDGHARVVIEDDGRGFDPETATRSATGIGLGLHGIRERVELLGGHMEVESTPRVGTTLAVQIPR
jgi:PAS domain S-box-containing protein